MSKVPNSAASVNGARERNPANRLSLLDVRCVIAGVLCLALYLLVYGRLFFWHEITHANDTHGLWTIPYLMFYSIINFGEFAWWDPTGLGGWPIYSYLLNWSYNVFSIYSLPYLALVKMFSLFVAISPAQINTVIAIQKLVYYFIVNLIGVYLICRALFTSRAATVFVLVFFTLGVIQFQGFRDSHQYEILPGALFYLFALFWFARQRTEKSFFRLMLFGGLFVMSGSYAVVQSPLYWTVLPTILLLLLDPSLLQRAWSITYRAALSWRGRAVIVSCLAFLAAALMAPGSSVLLNVGELLRVTGHAPVEYNTGLFGDWDPPYYGTPAYQSWTIFATFIPSFSLHDHVLPFDPYRAGVDHHYVGISILPLALIGVILGYRNKIVVALMLTAILCATFLLYTIQNGFFFALMELPLFRNVRTIGSFIARDGVALCLIILAAFGLEHLMGGRPNLSNRTPQRADDDDAADRLRFILVIGALVAFAVFAVVLAVAANLAVRDPELRRALVQVAGALLGTVICLAALVIWQTALPRAVAASVLILIGASDLTEAGYHYFIDRLNYLRNYESTAWATDWAKPAPKAIEPIDNEADNWVGKYVGIAHHLAGGPWQGLRTWLVLVTHPAAAELVENWNPKTLNMTAYPHFRLFENARYIPFEAINRINDAPMPAGKPAPWFYVHDESLLIPDAPAISLNGTITITEFSLSKVRTEIDAPKPGFLVFYDNDNRFWRAKVNGGDASIHRANFAFKAVKVPPGRSVVEWRFDPWPVKIAWLAAYGMLILFLASGWVYNRSRDVGAARKSA